MDGLEKKLCMQPNNKFRFHHFLLKAKGPHNPSIDVLAWPWRKPRLMSTILVRKAARLWECKRGRELPS